MSRKKDRLLTRAQVERRAGLGPSVLDRKMNAGEFPKAIKVGKRSVRWSEHEVEAWVASLPRSAGAN